jgi:hypothetical protein
MSFMRLLHSPGTHNTILDRLPAIGNHYFITFHNISHIDWRGVYALRSCHGHMSGDPCVGPAGVDGRESNAIRRQSRLSGQAENCSSNHLHCDSALYHGGGSGCGWSRVPGPETLHNGHLGFALRNGHLGFMLTSLHYRGVSVHSFNCPLDSVCGAVSLCCLAGPDCCGQ